MKKLLTLSAFAFYFTANAQTVINTVAGNGSAGYTGDGAQATAANLNQPTRIVIDNAGNLIITDRGNNAIRQVSASGIISTIAGNGTAGYTGDGAAATAATLNMPAQTIADASGNLYISDSQNNCIRKITASTGVITTIVGTGVAGYNGDSIAATAAQVYNPYDMAFDWQGNLYFSDRINNRVRKVIASSNMIVTVAGNGTAAYLGDSGQATSASLNNPIGLAVDSLGNIYIGDYGNKVVRKVDASGIITTFAGTGVVGFSGDGGPASAAQIGNAATVALDQQGNVYITDVNNNRVRKVNVYTGIINTIAGNGVTGYSGDGGLPTAAELNIPGGTFINNDGSIYIADQGNNCIRKISQATTPPPACSIAFNVNYPHICSGNNIALTVSGSTSYTWQPTPFSSSSMGDSVIVNPLVNTTYTVTAITGTCTVVDTISINVTPAPVVTFTMTPDSTPQVWSVYTSYSGVDNAIWSWGDGSTTQGLYPNHTFATAGHYNICVMAVSNACGDSVTSCQNDSLYRLANSTSSNVISVHVVSSTTGIKTVSATNQTNLYPNPAQNNFIIETNNTDKQTIQVVDISGKIVLSQAINGTTTIDASNFNAGVYNLSIISNNGVVNKKLVIVK